MVIDDQNNKIYLLGGYNGKNDLSDFWCYDIIKNEWKEISQNTKMQGGPGERSCHKMVFDPFNSVIYVFGKYLEEKSINKKSLDDCVYVYKINDNKSNKWDKIKSKVKSPGTVYDHQMVINSKSQLIYLFGGKELVYSGDVNAINQGSQESNNIANNTNNQNTNTISSSNTISTNNPIQRTNSQTNTNTNPPGETTENQTTINNTSLINKKSNYINFTLIRYFRWHVGIRS